MLMASGGPPGEEQTGKTPEQGVGAADSEPMALPARLWMPPEHRTRGFCGLLCSEEMVTKDGPRGRMVALAWMGWQAG